MRPIVFLDTETLGLSMDSPIWEIALIRRDERGETGWHAFITHDSTSAETLPESFRADYEARFHQGGALAQGDAAHKLASRWLAPNEDGKAVIVGSAPDFDMYRIQHQWGVEQVWHHHLIDAPTLAMGHWFSDHKARLSFPPSLDEAAKMFDIDPRSGRHTAMRDAELARDIFDAATHGKYGGEA